MFQWFPMIKNKSTALIIFFNFVVVIVVFLITVNKFNGCHSSKQNPFDFKATIIITDKTKV